MMVGQWLCEAGQESGVDGSKKQGRGWTPDSWGARPGSLPRYRVHSTHFFEGNLGWSVRYSAPEFLETMITLDTCWR